MIIEESTIIAAAPERIFRFFEEMEANYTRWHPDHIVFRWMQPAGMAVGSRFYFEERIHGQHIKRIVRLTRVEPGRLIEFVPDNALIRFLLRRVTFCIEPRGDTSRFIQQVSLRIGPLGRALNRKGFAAVEQHMHEEGENLMALVARQA